jgi:type VI protein secretion system component Hcp
MSNVTIKDLPRNEELDSNDMAAIEGGMFGFAGWGQTGAVQQAAGDQKVQLGDFQITKKQDKSSPLMM